MVRTFIPVGLSPLNLKKTQKQWIRSSNRPFWLQAFLQDNPVFINMSPDEALLEPS
jgi:hypothetical protein